MNQSNVNLHQLAKRMNPLDSLTFLQFILVGFITDFFQEIFLFNIKLIAWFKVMNSSYNIDISH